MTNTIDRTEYASYDKLDKGESNLCLEIVEVAATKWDLVE